MIIALVLLAFSATATAQNCPNGDVFEPDFDTYSFPTTFNNPHYEVLATPNPAPPMFFYETYAFENTWRYSGPTGLRIEEINIGPDTHNTLWWSGDLEVTFPADSATGEPLNDGNIWFYFGSGAGQEVEMDFYEWDNGTVSYNDNKSFNVGVTTDAFFELDVTGKGDNIAKVVIRSPGNELGIIRVCSYDYQVP